MCSALAKRDEDFTGSVTPNPPLDRLPTLSGHSRLCRALGKEPVLNGNKPPRSRATGYHRTHPGLSGGLAGNCCVYTEPDRRPFRPFPVLQVLSLKQFVEENHETD